MCKQESNSVMYMISYIEMYTTPCMYRKVEDVEDLLDVAAVSTSGDKAMAKIIASVFERVNMDSKVRGPEQRDEDYCVDSCYLLPLFLCHTHTIINSAWRCNPA